MPKVSPNKTNCYCKNNFSKIVAYIFYDFLNVTMSEKNSIRREKYCL